MKRKWGQPCSLLLWSVSSPLFTSKDWCPLSWRAWWSNVLAAGPSPAVDNHTLKSAPPYSSASVITTRICDTWLPSAYFLHVPSAPVGFSASYGRLGSSEAAWAVLSDLCLHGFELVSKKLHPPSFSTPGNWTTLSFLFCGWGNWGEGASQNEETAKRDKIPFRWSESDIWHLIF